MRSNLVAALALFCSAGATIAHSELPGENWCRNGRPVPILSIDLYGATIVAAREREQSTCRPQDGGRDRECGQFEDDYGTGRGLALLTCGVHRLRLGPGDLGTVIFIADGPESYLHPDHHDLYRAEHGLHGVCVRCERPLRPAR